MRKFANCGRRRLYLVLALSVSLFSSLSCFDACAQNTADAQVPFTWTLNNTDAETVKSGLPNVTEIPPADHKSVYVTRLIGKALVTVIADKIVNIFSHFVDHSDDSIVISIVNGGLEITQEQVFQHSVVVVRCPHSGRPDLIIKTDHNASAIVDAINKCLAKH